MKTINRLAAVITMSILTIVLSPCQTNDPAPPSAAAGCGLDQICIVINPWCGVEDLPWLDTTQAWTA
jgi:hypothetical protein